jgi:hypothetical protein
LLVLKKGDIIVADFFIAETSQLFKVFYTNYKQANLSYMNLDVCSFNLLQLALDRNDNVINKQKILLSIDSQQSYFRVHV